MRWGEIVRLTVEAVGPGGIGWVEGDGEGILSGVCVVPGALPGDEVEGEVIRVKEGRAEVRIRAWLGRKIERVTPRCSHFGVCGGCRWQDIPYADQLTLKRGIVEHCLREAGIEGPPVRETIGCEEIFFYRNKMEYSFSPHPPIPPTGRGGDVPSSSPPPDGEKGRGGEVELSLPFSPSSCPPVPLSPTQGGGVGGGASLGAARGRAIRPGVRPPTVLSAVRAVEPDR